MTQALINTQEQDKEPSWSACLHVGMLGGAYAVWLERPDFNTFVLMILAALFIFLLLAIAFDVKEERRVKWSAFCIKALKFFIATAFVSALLAVFRPYILYFAD